MAAALHDAAFRVCRHRFDRRQRETGKARLSAKGANRYRQRLFCKGGDLLGGREIVLVDGKAGSQRSDLGDRSDIHVDVGRADGPEGS